MKRQSPKNLLNRSSTTTGNTSSSYFGFNRTYRNAINFNRQRIPKILFILFLLVALRIFVFNGWLLTSLTTTTTNSTEKWSYSIKEVACKNVTPSTCFVISDLKSSNGLRFYRRLQLKGVKMNAESLARLIIDSETNDTTLWSIDHESITAEYIAWMIVTPFLIDSMSSMVVDNDDHHLRFLMIGLGGGCLPTFIHRRFPLINITVVELEPLIEQLAIRWFDFKTDSTMHCVLDDGVHFLQTAVSNGDRYNAIMLDACGDGLDVKNACPVRQFLREEVIDNAFRSLDPMGILVVNVLTSGDTETNRIKRLYRRRFPTVIAQEMSEERNMVLICLPYAIENFDHMRSVYQLRLNRLIESFKLDIIANRTSIIA